MNPETNFIADLIKTAKKQIVIIVVGGILSAFTINLVFVFSINATIEKLRLDNEEQEKQIEELTKEIIEIYKIL